MSSHLQACTQLADPSHNLTSLGSINHISNINGGLDIHQPPPPKDDDGPDYMLEIRQQPQHARVALGKDKADRKPIDPPPILQLKVSTKKDPNQHFLQSPYYFLSCSLVKGDDAAATRDPLPSHLTGTAVSSLHRLRDTNNQDGGFFVFGDLSCKAEGRFRLLFTLYQMQRSECLHITSIVSQPFMVHTSKSFPGLAESTFLTRSFSDQGVRLRLRKDSRSVTSRKRTATAADFSRKSSGAGGAGGAGGASRRLLGARTSSTDDSSAYAGAAGLAASAFDPSAGYSAYDADSGSFLKRRRIMDSSGSDDLGAGVPVSSVITTYSMPSIYGTTTAHMQMPVSTVSAGTGSYGLSMPASLSTMGYGHTGQPHQPHHTHHTQQPPSVARQSPHAFAYGGALQTSPSSLAHYRPLYGSTVSPADASPRTHATTTPSGTSPPDAAHYTAQSGVGAMASFSQSMASYTYGGGLESQQQHHPQHHHYQHHQEPARAHHGLPLLDLQHVGGTGLGLDLSYDVDRHSQ